MLQAILVLKNILAQNCTMVGTLFLACNLEVVDKMALKIDILVILNTLTLMMFDSSHHVERLNVISADMVVLGDVWASGGNLVPVLVKA